MKKFFYLVAMATVMMTSCSKSDDMIENNGPEDLKIKFGSSAMSVDVKTRGPVNAQADINNVQLVRIADYVSKTIEWNASNLAVTTTGTAIWNSTSSSYDLTVATEQYYNADPDYSSEFTAYAPAATFAAGDGTSTFPTATWTIDGKTDILVSSDVANGTKNTTTALNFPLAHKLLQLRFFLVAEGAAAKTAWGDVTGIEILNSPSSAIATLPDATMSFPNSTPATDLISIPVYAYGTDNVLAATNKVQLPLEADVTSTPLPNEHVYVMVAPNTVDASKQFRIKVYTENNTDGTELPVELSAIPAAGDSYAVTLTFKATIIEFSATLTNWVTAGKSGSGTVE